MSARISITALFTFLFIGLFTCFGYSQRDSRSLVKWMTLEEAVQKSQIEKRKIIVEVYADWCHWCHRMDSITFQQPQIAKYLNEKYYPVKLNGEQKEEIIFKGRKYKFVPKSEKQCYHELVAELTDGQIGYPTIIFLDEDFKPIQHIQGYKEPEIFVAFISYFGQDYQKRMPWNQFFKIYKEEGSKLISPK